MCEAYVSRFFFLVWLRVAKSDKLKSSGVFFLARLFREKLREIFADKRNTKH